MKCSALLMVPMLLVHGIAWAQARPGDDPDLAAGRVAWKAQQYARASVSLSRYRVSHAGTPNHDADYMLGTSWCRLPSHMHEGAKLLEWLAAQPLSPALAQQVTFELSSCLSAKQDFVVGSPGSTSSLGAITAEGKLPQSRVNGDVTSDDHDWNVGDDARPDGTARFGKFTAKRGGASLAEERIRSSGGKGAQVSASGVRN